MLKPERGAQRATGNSLFLSEMADVAMNGVTRESCCKSPEARVRGSSASAAMCDHTEGLFSRTRLASMVPCRQHGAGVVCGRSVFDLGQYQISNITSAQHTQNPGILYAVRWYKIGLSDE
jgi:hypothetical protein